MQRRIVVTATGDSLITRRMPDYPDEPFRRMVGLIGSVDVAFTNMEVKGNRSSIRSGTSFFNTSMSSGSQPTITKHSARPWSEAQ